MKTSACSTMRPSSGAILVVLEVEDERFLAAVEPHEIGALAVHVSVVAAGEIALRAFDLDDAGARVGEAARSSRARPPPAPATRRAAPPGSRLHGASQYRARAGRARARRGRRGSGSSRSAPPGRAASRGTCARCRIPRRSRSRRASACTRRRRRQDASGGSILAMLASAPQGRGRPRTSRQRLAHHQLGGAHLRVAPWRSGTGRPGSGRSAGRTRSAPWRRRSPCR